MILELSFKFLMACNSSLERLSLELPLQAMRGPETEECLIRRREIILLVLFAIFTMAFCVSVEIPDVGGTHSLLLINLLEKLSGS